MKVLAISGNKGHGKSMAASLLPWQFQDSRCLHLSYYDALVHISPGFIKDETEGLIAAVNSISPNFFYETVKVKAALRKGLYDYLILDDVNTEAAMQLVKSGLGAVIIGVVKDFPYSIPYTVRNELSADVLGAPDIVIKNPMTVDGIKTNIRKAVEELRAKSMI